MDQAPGNVFAAAFDQKQAGVKQSTVLPASGNAAEIKPERPETTIPTEAVCEKRAGPRQGDSRKPLPALRETGFLATQRDT